MQTLCRKLEYCFLVETTKIDTITFLYKIALSENNVKTNRMGSTFLFGKFCFSLGILYIELI